MARTREAFHLALVVIAACANTDADPRPKVTVTRPTFTVHSDDDLQVPLMAAVANAEKSGADVLVVRIAPGTYKHHLVLEAPTAPAKLGFVVEPDGSGPVTLGGGVSITGKTIALSGVMLDGARAPGVAVSLAAYESLDVHGVRLVDVRSASGGERDPLIDLVARGKGAKAKLRDLWVVDCTATTLVRIPVNGPGRWASVALEDIAFAGNHAKVALDVLGTDALTIDNVFAAEPALADAWLQLGTFGRVAITHATIAVRTGLVAHRGHDKYPKVAISDSEMLGPKATEPIDARAVTWGKSPATIDAKPFLAAARAGKPPDRAKLRRLLP